MGVPDSKGSLLPAGGAIDLDLAFSTDAELAPALLIAAGSWCADPATAEQAWQSLLTGWLTELQGELPLRLQSQSYSLGLSLVGDAAMAALNEDWRAKAGPTDVLAFAAQDEDLMEDSDSPAPLPMPADLANAEVLELGDIVISLETASRQAPEHDNNLEQELLFLASHGLLHLLGWDHPDDASLTAMLKRQAELVQQR